MVLGRLVILGDSLDESAVIGRFNWTLVQYYRAPFFGVFSDWAKVLMKVPILNDCTRHL